MKYVIKYIYVHNDLLLTTAICNIFIVNLYTYGCVYSFWQQMTFNYYKFSSDILVKYTL